MNWNSRLMNWELRGYIAGGKEGLVGMLRLIKQLTLCEIIIMTNSEDLMNTKRNFN